MTDVYVVATAGHVDHGKSALIRALTGMEPDRLRAEQERGRSIDLGFCWTRLTGIGPVAFVDVPGHERYLGNALAGLGPSQAVLLVVAADDGVNVQTMEHLSAVDALGISHGVVAINRCDLADPAPTLAALRPVLAASGLATAPMVCVSARTGHGLDQLRTVLAGVLSGLHEPDSAAPTRLWIGRVFIIRGAGTVVTGTLTGGVLAEGDELVVARTGATAAARGLQCLREPVARVGAPARVAVNLRRAPAGTLRRGDALLSPGGWRPGAVVDVRHGPTRLPRELVVHIGTNALAASVRPLDGQLARLRLAEPVGLHVGDRLVLRCPGARTLTSGIVLDPHPPPLPRQRGAAAARAAELAPSTGVPDPADELRRRGYATGAFLRAIGVSMSGPAVVGDWYVDPGRLADLRAALANWSTSDFSPAEVARRLGLPDLRMLAALVPSDGSGPPASRRELAPGVEPSPADSLTPLPAQLQGLRRAELSAAVSSGALVRIGRGYLPATAIDHAATVLRRLPQPFTVSQARTALGVSRAVALPLLQHFDRTGVTECHSDRSRSVRP